MREDYAEQPGNGESAKRFRHTCLSLSLSLVIRFSIPHFVQKLKNFRDFFDFSENKGMSKDFYLHFPPM